MVATYRDIMKARSVSPERLSQAALSYAMGESCALFACYDAGLTAEDNQANFELLGRRLARMGVGFSRLNARFAGGGSQVIQFVCAGLLSDEELFGLLGHYGQMTAVRVSEGRLMGLETGEDGRRWKTLIRQGLDAGKVTAHLERYFGSGLYFDYPAQGFMQAMAEMAVVQKPPIWAK